MKTLAEACLSIHYSIIHSETSSFLTWAESVLCQDGLNCVAKITLMFEGHLRPACLHEKLAQL